MNIHYCALNSLPVIPVQSHMNPVHTLSATSLKIYFTLYLYSVQMHGSKTVQQHITHLHLFNDAAQILRIWNIQL